MAGQSQARLGCIEAERQDYTSLPHVLAPLASRLVYEGSPISPTLLIYRSLCYALAAQIPLLSYQTRSRIIPDKCTLRYTRVLMLICFSPFRSRVLSFPDALSHPVMVCMSCPLPLGVPRSQQDVHWWTELGDDRRYIIIFSLALAAGPLWRGLGQNPG